MLQTTSTAIGNTHVDRDTTFCFIVPIDLTTIFRGYGPLPAVVGTTDQTGAWDAAGQSRTILSSPTAVAHAKSLPITRDRSISLTSLAVSRERCVSSLSERVESGISRSSPAALRCGGFTRSRPDRFSRSLFREQDAQQRRLASRGRWLHSLDRC
jgi:hypothetical protein